MLSYGISINLINLGKEVICCWKDGWRHTANTRKEKEERERSRWSCKKSRGWGKMSLFVRSKYVESREVNRVIITVSVLPKNTAQCPRSGLEPGLLPPELGALTMRPPCLPQVSRVEMKNWQRSEWLTFSFLLPLLSCYVIYPTWETVFHHYIQTPGRELKIRHAVEYFWRNSRCLDSRWNTLSSI